jgi:hypothetical protein
VHHRSRNVPWKVRAESSVDDGDGNALISTGRYVRLLLGWWWWGGRHGLQHGQQRLAVLGDEIEHRVLLAGGNRRDGTDGTPELLARPLLAGSRSTGDPSLDQRSQDGEDRRKHLSKVLAKVRLWVDHVEVPSIMLEED